MNPLGTFYHLNVGWYGANDGWYSLPLEFPDDFNAISEAVNSIVP